jgi:phosphoserine phosphatase RsbU/P
MAAQPETILVVDSNQANRSTLSSQLEQLGYQVVLAEDGHQALDLVAARPFYALLLSIDLWGMNSYQVLERLDSNGALRFMPVILLTAADTVPGIARCFDLGISDYLALPALPAVLQARLNACRMQQQLRVYEQNQSHQEELLKIEHDVQIARQIQAGFLPDQLPQLPGWEIAACFHPAREVAGDFYDAFMITQNRRVGFVIADVCDKGVGASLFMALSRSLIRAFAQQPQSLSWANVLGNEPGAGGQRAARTGRQAPPSIGTTALKNAMVLTNTYIMNTHTQMNMFVTLFFGVLDPSTGALVYINGGHLPPLILGPAGIKSTLALTGPAIGLMPDVDFEIGQAQLEPGDMLFCYTDGVTDARSPSGEFFGTKRLHQLLEATDSTATSLLDRVESNVQAHIASAAQFDDITMLGLRRA